MKNAWLDRKNEKNKFAGFPADDEYSIMQGCGSVNLNMWYGSMFMQNEEVNSGLHEANYVTFNPTESTPVLPGTMTGEVYLGFTMIQQFSVMTDGFVSFNMKDLADNYIECATLNHNTGEITAQWKAPVPDGVASLIVSYEYPRE